MTCKREQIHVLNYHVSYYEDNENQTLCHKLCNYEMLNKVVNDVISLRHSKINLFYTLKFTLNI